MAATNLASTSSSFLNVLPSLKTSRPSPLLRGYYSEKRNYRCLSMHSSHLAAELKGRRDAIAVLFGFASCLLVPFQSQAVEDKPPLLCDDSCEKELENVPMVTTESGLQYKDIKVGQGPSPPVGFQVAANYVAMVPSGKVFDSSLEKSQLYIFRVGAGQVIKGLDEGILSMKIGGKRRLYIPGSLAFPKGLTSAPGRPRVLPNTPVVFDVSLEYVPGLEIDEE